MASDLSRIWSSKRTIGYNARLPSTGLFANDEHRRKERNASSYGIRFAKMSPAQKLQVLDHMTLAQLRAAAERISPPEGLDDDWFRPARKENLRELLRAHATGSLEEASRTASGFAALTEAQTLAAVESMNALELSFVIRQGCCWHFELVTDAPEDVLRRMRMLLTFAASETASGKWTTTGVLQEGCGRHIYHFPKLQSKQVVVLDVDGCELPPTEIEGLSGTQLTEALAERGFLGAAGSEAHQLADRLRAIVDESAAFADAWTKRPQDVALVDDIGAIRAQRSWRMFPGFTVARRRIIDATAAMFGPGPASAAEMMASLLGGHGAPPRGAEVMALGSDDEFIVVGTDDGSLIVYDARTNDMLHTWEEAHGQIELHQPFTHSLMHSVKEKVRHICVKDGIAITSGDMGGVRTWCLRSKARLGRLQDPPNDYRALRHALSRGKTTALADGEALCARAGDPLGPVVWIGPIEGDRPAARLHLLHVVIDKHGRRNLGDDGSSYRSVDMSVDTLVAARGHVATLFRGVVRLWLQASGQLVRTMDPDSSHVAFLGPLLVTSAGGEAIDVWALEGGRHLCELRRPEEMRAQYAYGLTSLKTSPYDGGVVYVKFKDGRVIAWRAAGSAARARWRRAAGVVHALLSARNRAAERLYAFGGSGYEASRVHFESLLQS